MKTYTKEELSKILELHKKYLGNDGGEKANLSYADLSYANLSYANLSYADLRRANLSDADLRRANLSDADLSYANLSDANLSGAKNLQQPQNFIKNHFKYNKDGLVVYRRYGNETPKHNEKWNHEPGAILSENCNPCPVNNCACGVNFGSLEWGKSNYKTADLWECLISWEDLPGVVVPYNSDGKCRCNRLTVVKLIQKGVK